jgi:hypothetical protein
MEISFHNVKNITAISSFGENASWVDLDIVEIEKHTGKVTKTIIALFLMERDAVLCAKLAQAINQCFAEAAVPPRETRDEVAQ